jgi:hypothetical protein
VASSNPPALAPNTCDAVIKHQQGFDADRSCVTGPQDDPPEPEPPMGSLLGDSPLTLPEDRSSEWPVQNRQLLGLLGILGTAETAFLTYEKLFAPVSARVEVWKRGICADRPPARGVRQEDLSGLCSVGGLSLRCNEVFSSVYADFLGEI